MLCVTQDSPPALKWRAPEPPKSGICGGGLAATPSYLSGTQKNPDSFESCPDEASQDPQSDAIVKTRELSGSIVFQPRF